MPLLMSLIAILLPLSAAEAGPTHGFVKDANMWQDGVAFHANGVSASLYFRSDAVVIEMKNPTIFSGGSPDPAGCTVWMRFQGANPSPTISGQGEMMTRYSYYLGSDPEGWALNVPVYSGVVYRDLWPGIDLTFTELPGVISYVISLEEWADLDDVQFSFEGADQVTQTDPYTWTILTGLGQLRFRRDAHLQRAGWLQFPGEAKADKGLSDDPPDIRWGSFLGGGANVGDMSLARDANGNIYVAGTIGSSFLSSLPGDFDAEKMGPSLVFVSKLDPTGSRLMWSTFLGGSGSDEVADIALDGEGNPVLTGTTGSTDFPLTQGAYRTSHGGNHEAFVLELTGSYGHLAYSTLVGHGYARALAVDGSGRPLVAGQAFGDFPTSVNGYDRTYDGTGDAFVAKLSATGRALVWATFLGGNFPDEALDLALDGASRPVVVGRTRSSDFPTSSGAYDRSQNGGEDAFLSCLTADGTGLAWSTLLGGGQDDRALAVSLDPTGRPVVSGWTASSSFPTTSGAHDRVLSAGYGQGDIFVSKLAPTGSGLTWSTFLGGAQDDVPYGLVLDDGGNVLVTGVTTSPDFPVSSDTEQAYHGGRDVILARLDAGGASVLDGLCLGGAADERGTCLIMDSSGQPVLAGLTMSSEFPSTAGSRDPCWHGPVEGFVVAISLAGGPTDGPDPGPQEVPTPGAIGLGSYPNPFNPATRIRYSLPAEMVVTIRIYDVAGRLVRTLVQGQPQASGQHELTWNGQDDGGGQLPSGIYLCRLQAGRTALTHRLMMVK